MKGNMGRIIKDDKKETDSQLPFPPLRFIPELYYLFNLEYFATGSAL